MNDVRPFHDDGPNTSGTRRWQTESEQQVGWGSWGGPSRIKSESPSTAGKVFWLVTAMCMAAAVVMLTIKLGVVLFS